MGQNDRQSPIVKPPHLLRALTASLMVVLMAISAAAAQTTLDKVSFGTNWVPEAEHGGFFQALADGTYKLRARRHHRAGWPQRKQPHAADRRQDRLLHEREYPAVVRCGGEQRA